jgi:hypothetical protein
MVELVLLSAAAVSIAIALSAPSETRFADCFFPSPKASAKVSFSVKRRFVAQQLGAGMGCA